MWDFVVLFPSSRLAVVQSEVEWYAEHGAQFLKDSEYPTLPGFKRSFVTYQPLGLLAVKFMLVGWMVYLMVTKPILVWASEN